MLYLLAAAAAVAPGPMPMLIGSWRSTNQERPIEVDYRGISNGLATAETWRTASGREMMTLYVEDNKGTTATHYCGQGNVATLRLEAKNGGRTDFAFVSATGVERGEGVLVRLSFVVTPGQLRRIETYREDGRDSTDVFEFVRVRRGANATISGPRSVKSSIRPLAGSHSELTEPSR